MKKRKRQKSINRRIDVAPEGGDLATLGFYTGKVQTVVRRWKGEVEPKLLEDYFRAVARPVISGTKNIHFSFVIPQHWPLVFQLGEAIAKVVNDDGSIDKWLLTTSHSVAVNGQWDSWDAIAEFIGKRVGQSRSKGFAGTVKARAKRLRLLTPGDLSADFFASWPGKAAVTKQHPKT